MTTMAESMPTSRKRSVMASKHAPDSAEVTAEEASRGYVRIPSSMLKLLFGLVALLAIVLVLALGLLWSEHTTYSRQSNAKDQRISNLGVRVNEQQAQIDNLIARAK